MKLKTFKWSFTAVRHFLCEKVLKNMSIASFLAFERKSLNFYLGRNVSNCDLMENYQL